MTNTTKTNTTPPKEATEGETTMTKQQDQHRTIYVARAHHLGSETADDTIGVGWSEGQAEEMARWNTVEANGNDPEQHAGWEEVWADEESGDLVIAVDEIATPEATEEDDPLEATLAERMGMAAYHSTPMDEGNMGLVLRCVRQGDAGEIATMIRAEHVLTDDAEAEALIAAIYAGGDAA